MKKNLFYYLFTVICSVTLFASCSDDDEKVVNPVPQTTFTGENGLQLTYKQRHACAYAAAEKRRTRFL